MVIGFYNRTIIIVSIAVLIILLFLLGIYLYFNYYDNYPSIVSDCPPNWDISYINNDTIYCVDKNYNFKNFNIATNYLGNVNNSQNLNIDTYDKCKIYPVHEFRKNGTEYNDIMCEKQKWAKKCNITWGDVFHDENACDNSKIGNAIPSIFSLKDYI